jgi:hypothetical protein
MPRSAPVVDSQLAAFLAGEPDPVEALVDDQSCSMVWKSGMHAEEMLKHGRLALLACGHFTITKSLRKAKCRRCGEMIRSGYDYDEYRNLGGEDNFSWPGDPLRQLHEHPLRQLHGNRGS